MLGTHSFDVTADRHLDKLLEWVFTVPWVHKLGRFKIVEAGDLPALVLSSLGGEEGDGWNRLPAPVGPGMAAPLILAWLEDLPREKWPREPDIDGSTERGWRLTDSVIGMRWTEGVFCVVRPAWTEYHK